MHARLAFSLAAAVAALPACATDTPSSDDGDPQYDADPSDFDSKADGISSTQTAVLSFIDSAQQRLYVQLPRLTDKTMLSHLRSAAARGVDVHAYLVVRSAAHPTTVLAAEQLEAAGVDVMTERTTRLPGFYAIADSKMLTSTTGSTTSSSTTVSKNATLFESVIAEDVSQAPPALGSDGTALMLMPDSHAGPIVALMNGAKSSIDLEIYQLQSPAAVAALVAAQQRGVAVRVMLEPKTVGAQNYKMVSPVLEHAGIAVRTTPPTFDSSHNVDHAKFMVIDGHELVFGSGNMVRSGLGGNPAGEFDNRDFWIRDTRSASVAEAQRLFEADWNHTSTTSDTYRSLVLTPDNADAAILAVIDHAKTHLYLYNQSLNDATLLSHLAEAKQRGVDVHVLLGMQPGFGGAPPANQPAIDELTAAGIPAAFYTAHYLHGKVIVVDDEAFVGSQNFTSGGLIHNREVGEVLTSSTIVNALAQQFLADEAKPTP
jgi:phosphatidylserine/phosphatidylglycerophosphate/cardiolipin synthase-like enzyme